MEDNLLIFRRIIPCLYPSRAIDRTSFFDNQPLSRHRTRRTSPLRSPSGHPRRSGEGLLKRRRPSPRKPRWTHLCGISGGEGPPPFCRPSPPWAQTFPAEVRNGRRPSPLERPRRRPARRGLPKKPYPAGKLPQGTTENALPCGQRGRRPESSGGKELGRALESLKVQSAGGRKGAESPEAKSVEEGALSRRRRPSSWCTARGS